MGGGDESSKDDAPTSKNTAPAKVTVIGIKKNRPQPVPKPMKWGVLRALAKLRTEEDRQNYIDMVGMHSTFNFANMITSSPDLIPLGMMLEGPFLNVLHSFGYFFGGKGAAAKEKGTWGFWVG